MDNQQIKWEIYLRANDIKSYHQVERFKRSAIGQKAYKAFFPRLHEPDVNYPIRVNKVYKESLEKALDKYKDEEPEMRYYLAGLQADLDCMERGLTPPSYTKLHTCEHCGPVLVHPQHNTSLKTCAWCSYIQSEEELNEILEEIKSDKY